ncbi:MAG TPA: type II secretion system F family protein [Acidimicrobiales bacterium]|nr:type II secretion system F family protein [Acidimicrobiales bacterium]
MSSFVLFLAFTAALGGAIAVAVGHFMARRPATDLAEYLHDLDGDVGPTDEFERKLAEPFFVRVIRPVSSGAVGTISRLTPRNYLDSVHKKILLSGISGSLRAEEFVVAQAASCAIFTLSALAWIVLTDPAGRLALLAMILLPAVGLLLPTSWLTRKVEARKLAIRKDLPDMLDLLAISVEAGMGFEGALDIVCQHFESPLAEEFSRTLREMELGLPRRDAFQNLKRRTEVPELSNFVLALLQADALGIPVGRVLRTQALEMRAKRRQWAREKAAKLPVKILFPLVGFIFPSIMIVVLGPGAEGIYRAVQ